MLKRTITYDDPFNAGKQVNEEHYFHISKADLIEMEMEEHGDKYEKNGQTFTGMQAKLQRIVDSEDGRAIMREFKDIIRRSYGRKEGDRFIKKAEYWEDFEASEAFSQLLFELCTSAEKSAEFVNSVVPGNLEQIAAEVRAEAERAQAGNGDPTGLTQPTPEANTDTATAPRTLAEKIETATKENPVVLTTSDLADIDSDELKSGLAVGKYKLS